MKGKQQLLTSPIADYESCSFSFPKCCFFIETAILVSLGELRRAANHDITSVISLSYRSGQPSQASHRTTCSKTNDWLWNCHMILKSPRGPPWTTLIMPIGKKTLLICLTEKYNYDLRLCRNHCSLQEKQHVCYMRELHKHAKWERNKQIKTTLFEPLVSAIWHVCSPPLNSQIGESQRLGVNLSHNIDSMDKVKMS